MVRYSQNRSENWLIIGGGLAGALVAQAALDCGVKVTLCDPYPGGNAPPGGIVHPYPGRRYVQNGLEAEAFLFAQKFYTALAANKLIEIKANLPVVRPAETCGSKTTALSEENFDRRYLALAEVEKLWPLLNVSSGAITYSAGMVVNVKSLVNVLLSNGPNASARIIPSLVQCLERRPDGWHARGEFGEIGPFSSVVCAVGSQHASLLACSGASRNFGSLAFYGGEGQPGDDCQVIISGRGHFAPLPQGGYVVGSTYIHPESMEATPVWSDIDEAGYLEGVRKRLIRPQGLGGVLEQLWHGSRATVPQDKQPVVGLLTGTADYGLWMIGGLASRGLFWAPWLATRLVGAMLHKSPDSLSQVFSPRRLKGFDSSRFELSEVSF